MKTPEDCLGNVVSPSEVKSILSSKGIEISERELRRRAREIGAYRQIGNKMFFLPEDLDRIMEPKPKPVVSRGRRYNSRSNASSGLNEARATLAKLKQERSNG